MGKRNAECRMQNAVSRQKRLIIVFDVANAQKQGAIGAECTEASSATMFQELEQNAECRITTHLLGRYCHPERQSAFSETVSKERRISVWEPYTIQTLARVNTSSPATQELPLKGKPNFFGYAEVKFALRQVKFALRRVKQKKRDLGLSFFIGRVKFTLTKSF